MRDEDRARLVVLVQALAAMYRQEATEAMFLAYELGLGDLPAPAIDRAFKRAIRIGGQFMPSPSTLREFAGEQPQEMRALIAWGAVKRAISQHGAYMTVQFSDPAITAAVRLTGGWQRLCGLGGDELDTWARKEFERAYGELVASGVSVSLASPLPGIFASHDQPDPDSVRVRLVAVPVEPAALAGVDAPAQVGAVQDLVAALVGRNS